MKLSRRSLLAAPFIMAAATPALALAREDAAEKARAVIHDLMGKAPFPAASAAVWHQGGLVWSEAFGMADLEAGLPATTHDRFRLASVSKVLAAAAALRLATRGAVDLDAPIGRYRPSLPAVHRETTLRQLLSHQGGVRHYIPRDHDPAAPGGPIDQRTYAGTDDKLAIFINDPLVAAPGEAVHYSTFGFTLVGAVLESATGRSFPRILADEVTGPLALGSVEAEVRGAPALERVRDYQPLKEPGSPSDIVRCPPINPAYKWPGGGLLGAAPDIARFCGALTRPGYLSAAGLAEMFTVNPARTRGGGDFGVGWDVDHDGRGRRRAWHAGSIVGGRSIVMMLPDHALGVAVLANLGQVDVDSLVPAQRIAEAFLA